MSTPMPPDGQTHDEPQLPPPAAWDGFAMTNRAHIRELEEAISPESADRIHQIVDRGEHLMMPPQYLPLLIEAVENARQTLCAARQLIDDAVQRVPRVNQSLLGIVGRCPDLLADVIAHNNVIARVMADARELAIASHPWLSALATKYLSAKPHEWTGEFEQLFSEKNQVGHLLCGCIIDLASAMRDRHTNLTLLWEWASREEFGGGDGGSGKGTSDESNTGNNVTPTHGDQFDWVKCPHGEFLFTSPNQRHAVRALWEDWERGGLGVNAAKLCGNAKRDRVRDIFRSDGANHAAWETLIVKVKKGVYKLDLPPCPR